MAREVRRYPRFRSRDVQLIELSVHLAGSGDLLPAELKDLSRGGAKLLISTEVPLRSALELHFQSPDLQLNLTVAAEICWSQTTEGKWLIGCEFSPRLPQEVLDMFFDNGYIERRSSKRSAQHLPVVARWEYECTPSPAFLWNFSEGGFCIVSQRKAGKRVSISAEEPVLESVAGKTRWELRTGGGYIVGCEFVDRDSYTTLSELKLPPPSPRIDDEERRRPVLEVFRRLIDQVLGRTTTEV